MYIIFPVKEALEKPPVKIYLMAAGLTFAFYGAASCKLWSQKIQVAPAQQDIEMKEIVANHKGILEDNGAVALVIPQQQPSHQQQHSPHQHLLDHRTIFLIFAVTLVTLPFIILTIHKLWLDQGALGALSAPLIYVAVVLLPACLYVQKRHLRMTLWRELKPACLH